MAEEKKKLSLEEAFEKLETVIETLERPETSLEESFQAYKEGVSLVQLCNEQIDRVEKEVRVLSQEGDHQSISAKRRRQSEDRHGSDQLQREGRRQKAQTDPDAGSLYRAGRAGRADPAFYGSP